MASQTDLEFTYSLTDRIVRLSLGEMADFSGAKYDGDFSLSLEAAQRRKHEYVAQGLGIRRGHRVLDLGCGWGPMLQYCRSIGAQGVGLTLSTAQAAACRRHGLDVRMTDVRAIDDRSMGRFDAVVSLGAFEHFCSREEHQAGKQEAIYADIFRRVASVLPPGGRFFLQTMVFGPKMIPEDQVSVLAPRGSDAWYLGLMGKQFPGSWLPYGQEQLVRCAAPHFRTVSSSNGRLDYIETIRQWGLRFAAPSLRKLLLKVRLLPRYLVSPDFRLAFTSGVSANTVCFERLLLDHFRLVFEKPRPGEPGAGTTNA
ncbi:MAG TPA: class I SAM-dependent methyltransferase [Gemmatimonadales bacterium]